MPLNKETKPKCPTGLIPNKKKLISFFSYRCHYPVTFFFSSSSLLLQSLYPYSHSPPTKNKTKRKTVMSCSFKKNKQRWGYLISEETILGWRKIVIPIIIFSFFQKKFNISMWFPLWYYFKVSICSPSLTIHYWNLPQVVSIISIVLFW